MSVKRYMKHTVSKYMCVFGLFQLETTKISALLCTTSSFNGVRHVRHVEQADSRLLAIPLLSEHKSPMTSN